MSHTVLHGFLSGPGFILALIVVGFVMRNPAIALVAAGIICWYSLNKSRRTPPVKNPWRG